MIRAGTSARTINILNRKHVIPSIQHDILALLSDDIEASINLLIKKLPASVRTLADSKKQLAERWLPDLLNRLHKTTELTLLAHFKSAESEFNGDTFSEKMGDFCSILQEEAVRQHFRITFPILFEYIDNQKEQWIKHSLQLTERYIEDLPDIITLLFSNKEPGKIQSVQSGLGDKHHGGLSVTVMVFESGCKLIYIPRERPLHRHFNMLCQWLDRSLNVGFRTPSFISRETHTWMEYIEHDSCTSIDQVHRFYERTGVLLALLYTLDATDFHYENIIACGEYPVLIDLESFFHPFMPFETCENAIGLYNSVLKTGMLPTGFSVSKDLYPDMSGLGNPNDSFELNQSLHIYLDNKGDLKMNRKRGRFIAGMNLPELNGQPVEMRDIYSVDLKQGFRRAYLFLLKYKQDYLEKIQCFKNDEIRLLFRHTAAYSHLLKEGLHPDIVRNKEQTERHLNWLDQVLTEYPVAVAFLEAEKEDMRLQDIPYFYTKADSNDLWHNGKCLKKGFFKTSGFQTVVEKIRDLSMQDMERQCWIIDMSLSIKGIYQNSSCRLTSQTSSGLCFDQERYVLDSACHLADRLIKTMQISDEEACWMVFKPTNLEASRFELTPASFDLYSGMPGEILCLSTLEMLTGEKHYGEIAMKALRYLTNRIDSSFSSIRNLGMFGGWGGLIYTMALLSSTRKDSRWIEEALCWLNRLKPCELAVQEANHGLVNGVSGFILACLTAYKVSKVQLFIDVADKLSGLLLRSALQTEDHIKWKGFSKQPLAGLSHGASGYALCFSRLYRYTGTRRYKDIVCKILNYETHLFNPEARNWPDLRDFVQEQNNGKTFYSTAWSHGAPGIGLTRIELLKSGIRNRYVQKDLEVALKTCLDKGFNGCHNLCYGNFGNLELLINYADLFNDKSLRATYWKLATDMLQDGFANGFRLTCANNYTPGLMNGITGVIYQCLRVYDPQRVPSILSLSV